MVVVARAVAAMVAEAAGVSTAVVARAAVETARERCLASPQPSAH